MFHPLPQGVTALSVGWYKIKSQFSESSFVSWFIPELWWFDGTQEGRAAHWRIDRNGTRIGWSLANWLTGNLSVNITVGVEINQS
jgi:hypothetical protein